MEINQKDLERFSNNFKSNEKNELARNAVTNIKLNSILLNREKTQQYNEVFSNYIDVEVKNSDQESSGRCWLFAFCNMLRLKMIKKYKLEDFEFSQSYLFFYDKLERSNYFLNNIIETKKLDINDRLIHFLLNDPTNDGGNWNMILNIVNKYGIVPKTNFNESFQTNSTDKLNDFLNNKLRDYANCLRNMDKSKTQDYIKKCMSEIYNILVIFMGEPPKKISWEFYSDKKYKLIKDITPLDFFKKHVPINVDNMIVLINNPCKPYYRKISIKYFNNMVNGEMIQYINVPIDYMKKMVKKSIDNQEAVWFGCDVGKYMDSNIGILDIDSLDYKKVFNTDIFLNKKNRLFYRTSDVTHAMIIKGYDNETYRVNINSKKSKSKKDKNSKTKKDKNNKKKSQKQPVSNKPIKKYLVENSWGSDEDYSGNFVMTDNYFNEYLYEIVVNKKHVDKKIINILKAKPIMLEPWEPLGYLLL